MPIIPIIGRETLQSARIALIGIGTTIRKTMTETAKNRSGNSRIAVGIVVGEESLPLLHKTVTSAQTLSDHIFVLALGEKMNIAESHVNVYYGGWADDEAGSKNMLIDHIEAANVADYLVWFNPGEEFDEKTLDEFRLFLEQDCQRDHVYMMVLHRFHREDRKRHDFDEETIEARLMPLRKGIRFQGRVRATFLARCASLMTQISAAPGRFLLPSKKIDPMRTKNRAKLTLKILEKVEKEGDVIQDDLLAARAEAQFILGNYVDSRKLSKQLIKETSRSDLRLSAYFNLWETFAAAPIPDAEVTKLMIEALDHYPVEMQLLTFLGSHLQRTGQLELAERTFETAVQHGKVSLDIWHRLRIREIAVTSWALCLRLQDRNGEAIHVMESNVELVDDRSDYNRHLLVITVILQHAPEKET